MKAICGVLSLSTLLAAGAAFAGPEAGNRGGRDGRHLQWLADQLGLTDEQQAEWKTLNEANRTEMEPLRKEGRELHQKLRTALKAENADPQAVGATTLALERHRKTMETARQAFRARLNGVLTPEQKAKLDALKAERGERRGPQGPGRRGPGGRRAPEAEPPAGAKS